MLLELIKALFTPKAPAVHISTNALDPQRMIDEAEQDWGAKFDRDFRHKHIIYREGANADGTLNDNRIDLWNDQRCIVQFYDNGKPYLAFQCEATTEPGTYYDRTHVIGGPLGAALIDVGQQASWQVGLHHPGYAPHESLVQSGGPVRVYRDFDRSFRRQRGHITTGWYGINQHSTGGPDAGENSIGRWSAGCLVARQMSKHTEFMRLLKTDVRYIQNHQYVFDTTVLPRPAR